MIRPDSRYHSLGTTRTVDSHASRLRRKLGAAGERWIANVWGVGYQLSKTRRRSAASVASPLREAARSFYLPDESTLPAPLGAHGEPTNPARQR
jgi:DNA-binding winged helix-turn-helix (wHTH) protein